MSEEELNALEEGNYQVEELEDSQLEDVAGGDINFYQCFCSNEC